MEGFIAIGRLTKPHGLRGELVFLPYVYDLDLLPALITQQIFLHHGQTPEQPHTVDTWRLAHKRVLMQLAGCEDVTSAERWREYEVVVPRSRFPALPVGEYYWFEIEGLAVYDHAGSYLGRVAEIIYTGSNDVYVVQDGVQERLVPALHSMIRTIDVERGAMHLTVTTDRLN